MNSIVLILHFYSKLLLDRVLFQAKLISITWGKRNKNKTSNRQITPRLHFVWALKFHTFIARRHDQGNIADFTYRMRYFKSKSQRKITFVWTINNNKCVQCIHTNSILFERICNIFYVHDHHQHVYNIVHNIHNILH